MRTLYHFIYLALLTTTIKGIFFFRVPMSSKSNLEVRGICKYPTLDLRRSGEGSLIFAGIRESCVNLPRGRTGAEKEPT